MFFGRGFWLLIVVATVGLMAAACGGVAAERLVATEEGVLRVGSAVAPVAAEQVGGLALIAHASAAVGGWEGSNALEALENAVRLGFRYIEVDMLYTTDGEIVLNHNWHHVSNHVPGVENGIMSHAEFMSHRIFGRFTPVDLEMLIDFLRENPGPRIITDTKATDYAALYAIAEHFPEYMHRFIPQVYAFEDVERIRNLGFEDIILTIYMISLENRDPNLIHQFATEQGLYAVAMPESWAVPDFAAHLDMNEMRYMVHTIDSAEKAAMLYDMGFYGIYTGFLAYDEDGGIAEIPLPLWDYLERIEHNLQYGLSEKQQDLAQLASFHKIGVPANVRRSEVMPVWPGVMSAPFVSPITGLVYLPAGHFDIYTQGMDWQPATRVLYITTDSIAHAVRGENHELFLFRDMLFISENVLRDVFGFEVLHRGGYVVVVAEDIGEYVTDEDLFEIAEILFAGN